MLSIGLGDSIQKYPEPGDGALGRWCGGQSPSRTGGIRGAEPLQRIYFFCHKPPIHKEFEHKIDHILKTRNNVVSDWVENVLGEIARVGWRFIR